MPSVIKVDQIQSDTGTVNLTGNIAITGNVNIDSGLVFVDPVNNRLGVGTTTPTSPLDVNGLIRTTGFVTNPSSGAGMEMAWDGTQGVIQAFSNRAALTFAPVLLNSGQLKFPGTQNSSSDSNTLDDYEEGTWTPTITSSGASGFTFLDQFGWYVKIGRQVSIFFRVNVNSLSSASGTATVFVSNLPFTSSSGNGIQGGLVLIDATRWGSNFPTAGYIVGASTNITLTRAIGTTVAGSDPTLIQASDLRTGSAFNGNTVQGSMTYLVPT